MTTSTGQILDYTYDGTLPKSETWSVQSGGTGIAGSVSRTFDNNFHVTSQSVNGGNTVSFGYDTDDLLTSAGAMTLSRSSSTGLLTGTAISNASDSYGYNSFGEVTSYAAVVNGNALYSASYTRDGLSKDHREYVYTCDTSGRLTDVTQNSTLIGHYEYDANGNRISNADNDQNLTFNQAGPPPQPEACLACPGSAALADRWV